MSVMSSPISRHSKLENSGLMSSGLAAPESKVQVVINRYMQRGSKKY